MFFNPRDAIGVVIIPCRTELTSSPQGSTNSCRQRVFGMLSKPTFEYGPHPPEPSSLSHHANLILRSDALRSDPNVFNQTRQDREKVPWLR